MNINPKAVRVLCYGDSNTWGRDPHGSDIRYPVNVRWTGLLQETLGNDYWIIEEGLGGRTTALDQDNREDINGLRYLKPCLGTNNPLDIVILMLGTNDFKEQLHQSPQDIANNISKLLDLIKEYGWNRDKKSPKIILISPPYVDESVPTTQEKYKGAEEKSKPLGSLYKKVAEKYNVGFINIAQYVSPSKIDGYHLDPEAHKKIAEVLAEKIRNMALTLSF